MTLRVVGAGLGRTGTMSLKAALERLLGAPCYHMLEVFQHADHVALWEAAARAPVAAPARSPLGDRAAWIRAGKIAKAMLDGAPRLLTEGATYFHTPAVRPSWSRRFERTAQIGRHIFYRAPIQTAMN